MEIQEGHYYRRRDNEIVGPATQVGREPQQWLVNNSIYNSNGKWSLAAKTPLDLIENLGLDPSGSTADTDVETGFPIGLSRRDYFAAAAMQGLLAHGRWSADRVVLLAVRYADELIAALESGSLGARGTEEVEP